MKKFIQLALATTLFLSCSLFTETIDPELVHKNKDKTAPVFTILSPVAESLFEERVTVKGIVDKEDGKISSIKWSVSDTLTKLDSGTIDKKSINPDRSFSFDIATVGYSSDIIISVSVVDWNGNASTKDIKLLYSGTFIPSFNAVSKNKSVELTWNAIDGINSYMVYYTDNESRPTPYYHTKKEPVTTAPTEESPLIIDNLQNGGLYRFMISATDSSGTVLSSRVLDSIPQSINTFTPEVSSIDNTVHIRWNTTYDGLKYNVFRSTEENGDYINISGDISSYQFTDRNVTSGTTYYYRVAPALNNNNFSGTTAIRHIDFNINGLEILHDIDLPGETQNMIVVNKSINYGSYITTYNYLYIAGGSAGLQVFDLTSNRLLYTLQLSGPALDITINYSGNNSRDGHAYIALGDKGVDVVKIKEDHSFIEPRFISNYYENPMNAVRIDKGTRGHIYTAELRNGLRAINISNNTALTGQLDITVYSLAVTTDNSRLYSSVINAHGIQLKSAPIARAGSTSLNEGILYDYNVSDTFTNLNPILPKMYGRYLYAGGKSGFYIFDTYNGEDSGTGNYKFSIKTSGPVLDFTRKDSDKAFLLEGGFTIRGVNTEALSNAKTSDLTKLKTEGTSIAYHNNNHPTSPINEKVIVTKKNGGLYIFDGSSTTEAQITSYSFSNGSQIISKNNSIYIQEENRINQLSIDDNTLVNNQISYSLPFQFSLNKNSFINSGEYSYIIADGNLRILINGTNDIIGVIDEPEPIQSVNKIGDMLILGLKDFNFTVIDISIPQRPVKLSRGQTFGEVLNAYKVGGYFYTLDRMGKLIAFKINKELSPIYQNDCSLENIPTSSVIIDNIIVTGLRTGSLELISLENPNNPRLIKKFTVSSNSITISKAGTKIVAVDNTYKTLFMVDVSNPSNPSILLSSRVSDISNNFTVVGDKFYYISTGDNTLKYIQLNQE